MYRAIVYDTVIETNTFNGLKCQASKIANSKRKPIDEMAVVISNAYPLAYPVKYYRTNKIYPNGKVIRGRWE